MKKTLAILVLTGILACSNPLSYEEKQNTKWRTEANLEQATNYMEEERSKLKTVEDVKNLQKKFIYTEERSQWTPDILTLFYNDLRDDCDGAVVLGIWALEQINIPSRSISLERYGDIFTHTICMSNDNKIFITNNFLYEFENSNNWREKVFGFLYPSKVEKGDFDYMIDRNKKYLRGDYVKE